MIKLQNYTPEIYYKESRDFQFIGRLFDLVLNAVKTDTDLLYHIPLSVDSDEKLLDLLAMTLGFKPKHQYNAKQLKAVCSVFSEILRNKGSIKALKIACEALFNSMDVNQELDYDFTPGKDNTELNLYIPADFEDITILTDLLSYVLPAGMSCNIIKELHIKKETLTELSLTDQANWYKLNTTTYSKLPRLVENSQGVTSLDLNTPVIKTSDAIRALMSNADITSESDKIVRPGFSVNSEIIKIKEDTNYGQET